MVYNDAREGREGDDQHLVLEVSDELLLLLVPLSSPGCDPVEGFFLRIPCCIKFRDLVQDQRRLVLMVSKVCLTCCALQRVCLVVGALSIITVVSNDVLFARAHDGTPFFPDVHLVLGCQLCALHQRY